MNTRVVLQARCSSSRLPGKVLLPVAGMPSVVLSAKRAATSGLDVLMATSTDPSDDHLVDVVKSAGFPVMRGPLDDVLLRYVMATEDLDDDDIVVRLTADNVVPDGPYIDTLIAALHKREEPYLGPSHPADGMPHGLSVEVFTARALREADRLTPRPEDREHVTPFLRRRYAKAVFRPEWAGDLSSAHLGCTVDTRADYERVARLMEGVRNPLTASAKELCVRLAVQEELVLCTAFVESLSDAAAEAALQSAIDEGVVQFVVHPDHTRTQQLLARLLAQRYEGHSFIRVTDATDVPPEALIRGRFTYYFR
ncbi:MAG: hypothetical protein U0V87_10830 [Acidobacteriota bacterium]